MGFGTRFASAIALFGIGGLAGYYDKVGLHTLWLVCQICLFYELSSVLSKKIKIHKFAFTLSFVSTHIFSLSYIFEFQHQNCLRVGSIMLALACFMRIVFSAQNENLNEAAVEINYQLVIIVLVSFLSQFVHLLIKTNPGLLILQFLLVIVNDSFAYFCGKAFGKHKLIKISPNKTVEGFFGGAAFTIGLVEVLVKFISKRWEITLEKNILYAFACYVAFLGPLGGFYASLMKRTFGVKDFSNLIPGHGGVMDRCDCQIISSFVLWLMIQ
ncbi:Phosphatidate_cytidylyltransferase [Hexamita inflata]|uniref:phosphatidate cytidylyltransferase n=1 Tax=Hexamita inflata TaxID=28002 RepID=A0AA86P183_9EUKA|nr:Phosphatidate cytidylyltransferase [Hexamita inflata]